MKSAREAALSALYEIEYNGAYSNIALKNILNEVKDVRERALATALVYGTVANKLTLDFMIEQLSSIKLKKLSKYILLIVRMGLYQIKYMDKIPANAAVNESVRLARRYGHKASAGFVNGVLRSATREVLKEPKELYVKYSFDEKVYKRLAEDYGDKAEEIAKQLNSEPKMTIRANRLKTDRDELSKLLNAEICPNLPDALYVSHMDTAANAEFEKGLFTVQDISPMAACLALAPECGDLVIDVCAAPGGKTTYLAEIMQNKGRIIAFDIHEHRCELIKKNAKRLGIDIIEVYRHDARESFGELSGKADRVLADVPCSGLGIARRKPELKYKTDFEELPPLQLEILSRAAEYVKPGGELVYSTCTLFKAENERVVEAFLKANPDFEPALMSNLKDMGFYEETPGFMTVLPKEADGFFIAKLRRKSL